MKCCATTVVPQEARVVQLVSHPFLGQDVLHAGPSQFGLSLHSHSGVSVTRLSHAYFYVMSCETAVCV